MLETERPEPRPIDGYIMKPAACVFNLETSRYHGRCSVPARLVIVVGLSICLTQAFGQESAVNSFYVAGQFDGLSAAKNGGGAGVEWVHRLSGRSGMDLGFYSFSLAESRWSYAKMAGYSRLGENTTLYGEADLGPGRQGTEDFVYQIYRAGITRTLVAGRFYAEVENQYNHIANVTDDLLKAGVILIPWPSLACRLNYHFSVAGNTDSSLVSGQFNLSRKLQYMVGFAVGRATPVLFDLLPRNDSAFASRELQGGVMIPVGKYQLGGGLDAVVLPDIRRFRVFFMWKIPL